MSIVQDPTILRGKPVISGTRIGVSVAFALLGKRYSFDRIVQAYPHLTSANVRECLEFAGLRIAGE